MTREEAAALLGVRSTAPSDEVRRAWRMWARVAHPDAGGDAAHFARLEQARRVLLSAPEPAAAIPRHADDVHPPARPGPPARPLLRAVLRRPARSRLLTILAVVAVGLAALTGLTSLPVALLAVPIAVVGAAWAVVAAQACLTEEADPGHRMAVLLLLWLPVAAAQVVISSLAGRTLLTVLPILALPLVAAVASVNPGAGMWRPIGVRTTRG